MRWAMIGLLGVVAMPAVAATQADIGVLTCTLAEHGEKDANPESQTLSMHCAFKPTGTGPEETYIGEIKKVGSQTELTGKRVLIWAVLGPSDMKLKPAVLAQTYLADVPTEGEPQEQSEKLVGERDKSLSLRSLADDEKDKDQGAKRTMTVIELHIKSSPG